MRIRALTIEDAWNELEQRLDEEGYRFLVAIHGFVLAQAREIEQERRVNSELRIDLRHTQDLLSEALRT